MTINRHQAGGAYPRWTPPSFDAEAEVDTPEAAKETPERAPEAPAAPEVAPEPVAPEESPPEPDAPPIKFPTAEEIENMYEQARAEGHAAGHEEGAAQARESAEELARVVAAMDAAMDDLDGEIAVEIVSLAVAVAQRLVKRTLSDQPEAIAEIVKEALLQLPQSKTKIHVHPQDARLIRDYLQDQFEHGHHQLVEDDAITRGGCRLEAAGCEIDATIETRWRRVLEGLGRDAPGWKDDDA